MTNIHREQPSEAEFQEFHLPTTKGKVAQDLGETAALATVTVLYPEINAGPTEAQKMAVRRSLNFMNLNPGYGDHKQKMKDEDRPDPYQALFDSVRTTPMQELFDRRK